MGLVVHSTSPVGIVLSQTMLLPFGIFFSGSLPNNFNSIHICLIPKEIDIAKVEQYRPITLVNFHYKIITKILDERLVPIALEIISP